VDLSICPLMVGAYNTALVVGEIPAVIIDKKLGIATGVKGDAAMKYVHLVNLTPDR
jgi:hypothetical protein